MRRRSCASPPPSSNSPSGRRSPGSKLATAIDAEVERRLEEQKRLAEEEARRVEEAAKRAKAAEERRLEDERRRKDEEERRLEDERRAQEAADEELARIAAAEGLLSDPAPAGVDKGKGRARVDEEVTELSDDPSVKTPRTLERPFAMTEVDMAAAAIEKRQAGQKFQQGCYFDKVSVLGKTKKTRGGGSTTKKRIRPASPGPSVADSSGSKKRRVDEPPRPLLRRPLDGASRLGLEQDDLDALDLDDESRGIIRVIREERAHIARLVVGAGLEEDVVVVEGIVGAGGAGLEFEAAFEGVNGGGGARSDEGMIESREEDAMGG
ncbi:predicted protein [Postia placenta Mad-698-R]|nr:predicted protein [Postia placenta Mad-698-R]